MKPQEVDRKTHKVANFLRWIVTYFIDTTKTHNLLAFVSCSVRCLISFCAIAYCKSKRELTLPRSVLSRILSNLL